MDMQQRAVGVLIVDDEEAIRQLLSRWVEDMGHVAETAADADEALAHLAQIPVNVAVCDVGLQGRSGVWLIHEIRRRHPGVAVVIATGLNQMDPAVTLAPGVVAYLVKPFSYSRFAESIHRAVASASALPSSGRPLLGGVTVDGEIVLGD